MRRWIAAGLLCVAFVAASQVTPAPKEQHVENQAIGDRTAGHPAAADQPPTPQVQVVAPDAVQPVGEPQTAEHDADENEGWWHKFTSDPIATLTGVLALLTGVLGVVNVLLVRGADRKAAIQLRAYVGPTDAQITGTDNQGAVVMVTIPMKNFGQTPAHDVEVMCRVVLSDPAWSEQCQPVRQARPSRGVLHPGEKYSSTWYWTDGDGKRRGFDSFEYGALLAGHKVVYVTGKILYKDAFGAERETHFRYIVNIPKTGLGMTVCHDGNSTT